jgi:excisionase family DNA binding protein
MSKQNHCGCHYPKPSAYLAVSKSTLPRFIRSKEIAVRKAGPSGVRIERASFQQFPCQAAPSAIRRKIRL